MANHWTLTIDDIDPGDVPALLRKIAVALEYHEQHGGKHPTSLCGGDDGVTFRVRTGDGDTELAIAEAMGAKIVTAEVKVED